MAINFNKLKDPKLGLLDMITIGKYKGCRVDSIVEQDYEYLIFMDKQKILVFQPEVLDKLKNKFSMESIEADTRLAQAKEDLERYGIASMFPNWKRPSELEKTDEYLKRTLGRPWYFSDMEDDVPF